MATMTIWEYEGDEESLEEEPLEKQESFTLFLILSVSCIALGDHKKQKLHSIGVISNKRKKEHGKHRGCKHGGLPTRC